MGYSNVIAFFVILATAVTLNAHGVTNIQTASQAAIALKPIAGDFASALFALAIVGTGLLAIPTLARLRGLRPQRGARLAPGAGAEVQRGARLLHHHRRRHYGGVVLSYSPLDPIKALFWSAVVNGVVAVPLMAIIMLLVSKKSLMGVFVATPWQRWGGWAATAVMGVAQC